MVTVEVWRIVIKLKHCLTKEDEGPRDGEAVRCLPLFLDAVEGLPSPLSRNIVHEAVLGGFQEAKVAYSEKEGKGSRLASHRVRSPREFL